MNPEFLLGIVSAFAAFLLKSTAAFAVCAAVSRLIDSPARRFILWLSFLGGAASYWIWVVSEFISLAPSHPVVAAAPIQHVSAAAVSSTGALLGAWQIPDAWAFPLNLAVRVAGVSYLFILGYLLLSHARKQLHLRWILGFTSEPPAAIVELFQPLAEELHAGRSRLLVLSGMTSPATFGWIHPTILLPADCLERDLSDLEDILRHELHHIRRADFAWNAFAMVCRALLFFHPAAWYAVRKMQYDRELACDLAVISDAPARRAVYAECLIRFARMNLVNDPKNWRIDFAASSEHLKARVQSILAGSQKTSAVILGLRTVCGVALLAALLRVAPSLAVLVSFAPRQIAHPLTVDVPTTPAAEKTSVRRVRSYVPSAPRVAVTARETVTDAEQPQADQSSPDPQAGLPVLSNGPGPGLRRRSQRHSATSDTTAGNENRPQTILFDDDGKPSQAGKKSDPDRADAVQQTATAAAALYRRLEDVKPER